MAQFPYFGTNIADASGTLSSQWMGTLTEANPTEWIAPYNGSVIGATGLLNGSLSTGSLALFPTVNGVAQTAVTGATLSSTAQSIAATQPAQGVKFAAGDKLGLGYTKSGTVSPTTLDGTFLLVVLYEGVDY